ncbi:hypothetical protein MMC29_006188 [Sticta canariensis]|nr:hypothetical protein [Sticta canariensis]
MANWHLGFTAFGGPPVQFRTFHQKFVEELGWIDEPMVSKDSQEACALWPFANIAVKYQQIFAISQALPGSASIKMIFTINVIRGGFMGGFISFLLFSLPGAIGMYGLSVGISRVGSTLPTPVYALLSGLNAATVGLIALAGVRLAENVITDRLTRALVYLGGVMGMLYTALWYYPVLMVGAGIATTVWDLRCLHAIAGLFKRCWSRPAAPVVGDLENCHRNFAAQSVDVRALQPAPLNSRRESKMTQPEVPTGPYADPLDLHKPEPNPLESLADFPSMSWKFGTGILAFFAFSFIIIITVHVVIRGAPRGFSLFADLYLAGTIIFGGGPVVIPLLREYIVTQGWVSPRDFLLGLAIIQSFPGPNFNFAIYLGSLATAGTMLPSFCGALIAFVAIYTPGLLIVVGFTGLWRLLRSRTWFLSVLRGVNASAVGLVYAAVYKLWQIGYLTAAMQGGLPLGTDPWLVAITATAFVVVAWYRVNPPVAILIGGIMGLLRFAIVQR